MKNSNTAMTKAANEIRKDPVKAITFLRRVLGEFHFPEVNDEEAARVWEQIKRDGLTPIDSSNSLHIFADQYQVGDEVYEALFPIGGNTETPMSIGKKTFYNWDERIKEHSSGKSKS